MKQPYARRCGCGPGRHRVGRAGLGSSPPGPAGRGTMVRGADPATHVVRAQNLRPPQPVRWICVRIGGPRARCAVGENLHRPRGTGSPGWAARIRRGSAPRRVRHRAGSSAAGSPPSAVTRSTGLPETSVPLRRTSSSTSAGSAWMWNAIVVVVMGQAWPPTRAYAGGFRTWHSRSTDSSSSRAFAALCGPDSRRCRPRPRLVVVGIVPMAERVGQAQAGDAGHEQRELLVSPPAGGRP